MLCVVCVVCGVCVCVCPSETIKVAIIKLSMVTASDMRRMHLFDYTFKQKLTTAVMEIYNDYI